MFIGGLKVGLLGEPRGSSKHRCHVFYCQQYLTALMMSVGDRPSDALEVPSYWCLAFC